MVVVVVVVAVVVVVVVVVVLLLLLLLLLLLPADVPGTLDIQKQLLSIERVAEMLRRWELSFWPVVVGNAVPNQAA